MPDENQFDLNNKGKGTLGAKPSGISFYKCLQPGHESNQCRRRKFNPRSNLIDHEVSDDYEDECGSEHVDGESGRERVELERVVLRHNLFRITCTSGGRLCSLMIDSGSTGNFVSQKMVDKLKLKTEALRWPYKISWFKEGGEVPATRCLIQFSVGKIYHDEVWCDVVPLQVCYIFKGRHWHFDSKTQHDDENNTYTLNNKIEIIL